MDTPKHTPGSWKILKNTDSVDVDSKCLGLSPRRESIPQDVWGHIASNRGLHIQVRHNKDPQAFAQAEELSSLIAAAPELLEALRLAKKLLDLQYRPVRGPGTAYDKIVNALKKAGAE